MGPLRIRAGRRCYDPSSDPFPPQHLVDQRPDPRCRGAPGSRAGQCTGVPGDLQEDAARLERLSAALFDLEEADLEARVASLRAEDEAALIEAMVLRASRRAARGRRRAGGSPGRARRESLDWLRAALERGRGPRRRRRDRRALAAAGGTQARRPLVSAAIETAAHWIFVELSPALAQVLDVGDAGLRAAARRDALRRLTGRDLESSASFAALSRELEARGLARYPADLARRAARRPGPRGPRGREAGGGRAGGCRARSPLRSRGRGPRGCRRAPRERGRGRGAARARRCPRAARRGAPR